MLYSYSTIKKDHPSPVVPRAHGSTLPGRLPLSVRGIFRAFYCSENKRRCFCISTMVHQINDEIRDKEVRLIDSDGSQLGIVNTRDALRMASERDLDLVKIAPGAAPPVCKFMDYGKFRFEQSKKEKEARSISVLLKSKRYGFHPASTSTTSLSSGTTPENSLRTATKSRYQSVFAAVRWRIHP